MERELGRLKGCAVSWSLGGFLLRLSVMMLVCDPLPGLRGIGAEGKKLFDREKQSAWPVIVRCIRAGERVHKTAREARRLHRIRCEFEQSLELSSDG